MGDEGWVVEFRRQCEAWAEIQRHDGREAARSKEECEHAKPTADCSKLTKKVAVLEDRVALWEKVAKCTNATNAALERKVRRRRRGRAEARELMFGPSMLAYRIWERTGRCDWAAVIRKEGLDGSDVMDFTLEDALSIGDLSEPEAFCAALSVVRDDLTRPAAELVHKLRDDERSPEDDWYEAQTLLRALFAQGLEDPVERRLEAVKDVVARFAMQVALIK